MTESSGSGRRGIGELAEDAVGFGAAELRLTRDLYSRPRSVMNAYDAEGPTAGGLYPKPLRYWLTVNGLYLAFMAVTGSLERSLQAGAGGRLNESFSFFAEHAGKSSEEFAADFESWMSLVALPIYALFVGGALFLLFRRWSAGDDRQDFRQTFTFLNAWFLWTLPFGLVATIAATPELMVWLTFPVLLVTIPLTYAVFGGGGRWWRTRTGAVLKGLLLIVVSFAALVPYSLLAAAIALAGASFLP